MRRFNNLYACNFFSQIGFKGFDGEFAAEAETHPRLCHLTTSALNTVEGEPWLMWHIFDYITSQTIGLPYIARLQTGHDRVQRLKNDRPELGAHVQTIPWCICNNMDELQNEIEADLDNNFEGTIIRKVDGRYKEGRSTVKEGLLLRIKPYMEVDAVVEQVIEGQKNLNEATFNHMGYTQRSTHAENMVPNGMVGSMMSRLCEDVDFLGKRIHSKGDPIKVSAGKLTHEQRALYFTRQDLIVGQRIKVQIFPIGIKEKPRHPTFQSFRSDVDVVER
jgi:DNA ligase-1